MSRIAAALVKLTCPDTNDGYQEECGGVEAFGVFDAFAFDVSGDGGGDVAMVRCCVLVAVEILPGLQGLFFLCRM